jgi:hypothetical protein
MFELVRWFRGRAPVEYRWGSLRSRAGSRLTRSAVPGRRRIRGRAICDCQRLGATVFWSWINSIAFRLSVFSALSDPIRVLPKLENTWLIEKRLETRGVESGSRTYPTLNFAVNRFGLPGKRTGEAAARSHASSKGPLRRLAVWACLLLLSPVLFDRNSSLHPRMDDTNIVEGGAGASRNQSTDGAIRWQKD